LRRCIAVQYRREAGEIGDVGPALESAGTRQSKSSCRKLFLRLG
jgi:hypothetical protein